MVLGPSLLNTYTRNYYCWVTSNWYLHMLARRCENFVIELQWIITSLLKFIDHKAAVYYEWSSKSTRNLQVCLLIPRILQKLVNYAVLHTMLIFSCSYRIVWARLLCVCLLEIYALIPHLPTYTVYLINQNI